MLNKESLKFVFIGAGSTVFTLRLIGDVLSEKALVSGEIVLVEIDAVVLCRSDLLYVCIRRIIAHSTCCKHADHKRSDQRNGDYCQKQIF